MTFSQTIEEGWKAYQESGYATDDPKDAFRAACYHMVTVLDTEEMKAKQKERRTVLPELEDMHGKWEK